MVDNELSRVKYEFAHRLSRTALDTPPKPTAQELLRAAKDELLEWLDCVDLSTDSRLKWYDAQVHRSIPESTRLLLDKIDRALEFGGMQ